MMMTIDQAIAALTFIREALTIRGFDAGDIPLSFYETWTRDQTAFVIDGMDVKRIARDPTRFMDEQCASISIPLTLAGND